MKPECPVVDRDIVDVTASLNDARRYGLLTETTAPFLTTNVVCHTAHDGTVCAEVALTWPDATVTTGVGSHTQGTRAVFDAYVNATCSVSAKLASVHTVATTTLLLEGGLGAEPATHVVVRCRHNNHSCVASGTHTDVHEAAWQAVSDIATWVLMYD